GRNRVLAVVTPRELGGGSGSDAATVRTMGAKYPDRILVLDWVRYSSGHSGWVYSDGLHLTPSGAVAFTHLLRTAFRYAKPSSRPPRRIAASLRTLVEPPSSSSRSSTRRACT